MPAAENLVDTGAIVAILDDADRWHRPCLDAVRSLRLPLLTSAAVLTEVFHLIGDGLRDLNAAWSFIRSGALTVAPTTDEELPSLHALMVKYRDRPMDFADATLVHLAEIRSLTTILTLDQDDFETYRIGGRRRFRIVPGRLKP